MKTVSRYYKLAEIRKYFTFEFYQECKARIVYCGRVYSAYIMKPVFFGRNL